MELRPAPQHAQHSQYCQSGPGCGHRNMSTSHNNMSQKRALEEAATSGFLNLSARKLKDFPAMGSSLDLTDTVEADLSRNRLTDIPTDVCHFVSLESLNLYHNCIRTIPDSIISLQMLTSLNLSRNQLSVLPACLCSLPLRVLSASNNKLSSLPEFVGQISSLMELDVSCNELTALPRHIGCLTALRELNVRRNLLPALPEDLAELPLVRFDFSCNKVSSIPTCYRKMVQLQSLHLENNPLQSPPAQICMKGKVHIFKYLNMEARRSDKETESLYLPQRPPTGSFEDIDQSKKQDTDSGVGSDNGDKRLSTTEPSDEDSFSLTLPMSHITEEEGLSKDDSSEHISALPESSSTEELKDPFRYRDSALSEQFVSYIQERGGDFDEPLRIDEESGWGTDHGSKVTAGKGICINMINQLKEAVELLQDPSRVSMEHTELYPVEMVTVEDSLIDLESENGENTSQSSEVGLEFQKKRELILERTRLEAHLACQEFEKQVSQGEDKSSSSSSSSSSLNSPPFGLKPRSVFLRSPRSLETVDPQFTIRRKMEQLREELELTEQLRESIESRLKLTLSDDLGSALMDGVVLCHLVNHIHPRAVASIHVPSPAVPKLSMAKCRRNVENFLDACRRMGVPESTICSPYDILQSDVRPVTKTVRALVALDAGIDSEQDNEIPNPAPTQATPTSWCFWDWISSSLLHLICLLLLFVVYSWSEFT